MTTSNITPAMRIPALLVGIYVVLSIGAVVVLAIMHADTDVATTDAWVHGIIVAATALLMGAFTLRARRGSAAAYLRLRISSAVMLVAIVVITLIPGDFPAWMKITEAIGGLCLLGVVVLINTSRVRGAFAR